jgi:hypothetical protein
LEASLLTLYGAFTLFMMSTIFGERWAEGREEEGGEEEGEAGGGREKMCGNVRINSFRRVDSHRGLAKSSVCLCVCVSLSVSLPQSPTAHRPFTL